MQNKLTAAFVTAALFLLLFVLLFLLRAYDDNSLFSWAWIFSAVDASALYIILIAALIVSSLLSRVSLPDAVQVPALATFSFLAAVPLWSEPEIIVDASRYFTQAKHLEVYGIGYFVREWGRSLFAWTDLPLVPLCYGILFKLFGESRTVIQAFTTALFSLTTVLTYRIGRTLWDRDTGLTAGVLLLGMPYLLAQVPLLLVDVPTMFLLALSLSAFLDALKFGGAARSAGAVSAIVLLVFSKYSAWFMLTALAMALIVYAVSRNGSSGGRVARGVIILVIAGTISGGLLLFQHEVVIRQIDLLRTYQQPGLARWSESHLSTFFFQVHPIITAFALGSIFMALRKRDLSYVIVIWPILLVVVFDIRRIRYVLPVFPLLALMAAYGLQAVRQEEARRFIALGIATTSLCLALFAYRPFAGMMSAVNLQHAGRYLNTITVPSVRVVTLDLKDPVADPAVAVALLDLYTAKVIHYERGHRSIPSREEIERSPLRFTWEYRDPAYYAAGKAADPAISPLVLIGDAADTAAPASLAGALMGSRLTAAFRTTEGIFRYAVGVRIYE